MVHLQRFHEKYSGSGILVFAISMESDSIKARAIGREMGLTYPVFDGQGSDLGARYAYG